MTQSLRFIALFLLFASPVLHAELSLNPLNWFKEPPRESRVADATEEAVAQQKLEKGITRMEAGRNRSAKRIFKNIAKEHPTAKAAADALYFRARILMEQGEWSDAFESLQEIVRIHPSYSKFNRVISAQFDAATALMEGAREPIIFGTIPGFRKYDNAVKFFQQIVANAPYGDYAPLSLMNIAIISRQRDQSDDAIDALDRLINYYPQSMLAPDAYYKLAQTYADLVKGYEYDQGSTREAIRYYEDFLILFPKDPNAGEVEASLEDMENLLAKSRLNLGDFYYIYRNNNTAALIFYNEAIDVAPNSDSAATARDRIADIESGVEPATGYRLVRMLLFAD